MSIFSSKGVILRPEWLEIVFDGRNKSYGAYVLRKQNSKNTVRAMVTTLLLFAAAMATPTIINKINGFIPKSKPAPPPIVEVLLPPPPPDAVKPPPPPPEPPRPPVDQLRFPPPVARPDDQVKDPDPPSAEELTKADPGQQNLKGDPTAPILVDEQAGTGNEKNVTEDHSNDVFYSVEKTAEYPGGLDKFNEYLSKSIRYPAIARENNVQGKVFMTFIVEKDGSLTDIKVMRGIGSGCDDEAIRVIKASKKWSPGMQNGRAVRQQYTVPISFTLAEN